MNIRNLLICFRILLGINNAKLLSDAIEEEESAEEVLPEFYEKESAKDKNAQALNTVITESGKINKFLASGFERSQRNKAGSKVIDLGKNDRIHSLFGVSDKDVISVLTTSDRFEIPVKDIQLASSVSKGTKFTKSKSDIILKAELMR